MLDLTSYSNNEYLSCLFGQDKTILEMWAMDWGRTSRRKPILVYAMISPADQDLLSREWKRSVFTPLLTDQYPKATIARIAKASIVDAGSTIVAVISGLLTGQSLQQACLNSNCSVSPQRFEEIKLGSQQEIEKRFVVRPPIASLSQKSVSGLSERKQGSTSPQSSAIAIVGSIFCVDKQALWLDENNKLLPNAHIVMREMTARLSSQTNMRFFSGDAKRLGNIEFFSFPTTDYRNRSKVTVESYPEPVTGSRQRSCRRIVVKLTPGALTDGTNILINCRLLNDNEIIADECKEGTLPANLLFSFEASEQVSAGDVRIWRKGHVSSSWSFWHQESFDLLRSISVTTSFPGVPRSDWLDKLKDASAKAKDHRIITIPALTVFDSYSNRVDPDFSQDPWNPIGANVVGLCKRLTSPRSTADFFLPSAENEDARIEKLSGWLEKRRDPYASPSTCVIMDPYFDVAGVEAIRKAAFQNTEIIVITNTQCSSFDDQALGASSLIHRLAQRCYRILGYLLRVVYLKKAKEAEIAPQRADRIRAYFATHATDFREKAVRVFDIRSRGRSTQQYFHDRYVLLFDMDGRLESGYNLSNSIQGAMKSYPLLITEMPFDILEPVQYYFQNFITDAASSTYRQIVELYSSQAGRVYRRPSTGEGLLALTDPAHLYAELLSEKGIAVLKVEQLEKWLLERGLVNENKSFKLPTLLRQAILAAALKKNPGTFRRFWKDVAEILARSNEANDFFASIPQKHGILEKLQTFLLDDERNEDDVTALQEEAVRSAKYVIDLCYEQDFTHCLSQASHIPGHRMVKPTYRYDIHEALQVLRTVEPLRLVKVIEDVTASNPTIRRKYVAVKGIEELVLVCAFASSSSLFSSMTSSRNQLVRAMAAMSQFHREFESAQNPDPVWVNSNFNPREAVIVLAEWVYELRLYANRKGGQEDDMIRMWRESAFDYMRNKWPAPGDKLFLAYVLSRVGGPTDSWARSTYQDLAIPLSQTGIYTLSDLRAYWYDRLMSKIETLKKDGQFFASADNQLTANAAHALVNEGIMIDQSVDEMKVRIDKCAEQLLRPRIQTTDYNTWIRHTWIILWVQTFLEHLLFYPDKLSHQQRQRVADVIALGDSHTFNRNDVMSQESYQLVVWARRVRDAQRGSTLT